MKLMLVGYLENQVSDRRITATSRMRMDILYFIGYDLDEELPWHSTLSRTRQLYGEELFTLLFRKVLKLCIDRGLITGKRQVIDSVFVKANAALSSMVERQILDDAAVYNKQLEANKEEEASDTKGDNKPDNDPSNKRSKRTNKTHVSPSDPDSRMSVKDGYIPNVSGYKAIREGFFYNQENDSYTCSQGTTLTFRRFRMRGEHQHKIYQSRTKD